MLVDDGADYCWARLIHLLNEFKGYLFIKASICADIIITEPLFFLVGRQVKEIATLRSQ